MDLRNLFFELYEASTEEELEKALTQHPTLSDSRNWHPYGDNENNYGVVENQQASPVPALVEKLINSIDAILMRRCLEKGINPKSADAPQSIDGAVERFFPDHKDWDLPKTRMARAEEIQVIADGPKKHSSVIIYDNGEGQHPDKFEDTFLSLLSGNKNEIRFVQGKYNMGGAGALIFCGNKRYQLVASRRYDGGPFGFTLVRKHPMTEEERQTKKNTWYEYLQIDGAIPRFEINDGEKLDLGLHNRHFDTGTVIKLYSYELPKGSRSIFSRDLNQSLNEYLFAPALPILTVDKEERYPNDRNLQRDLYGLKRRLEENDKYVEEHFSETLDYADTGPFRVTCYVFRSKLEGRSAKETKETIRREFFKNNMSVLFSLNGQVHGHYTTEFISRSLQFPLLKEYLLIHVDCTDLRLEFRNELFMASRDRLKGGEEAARLRSLVADALRKGRLKEVYKRRKASITVEGENTQDLIKNFAENLPLDTDLLKLLDQTFKLDRRQNGKAKQKQQKKQNNGKEDPPFEGKRYPTFLKVEVGNKGPDGHPAVKVPTGGEKTIPLSTDVEDQYLDRVEDPGELRLALLDFSPNETHGGNAPGLPDRVDKAFNVIRSSPNNGTIRITLKPTEHVSVGDAAKIQVTLTGPGQNFEGIFWAKVSEREKKTKRRKEEEENNIGLPKCIRVYEEEREDENVLSWSAFSEIDEMDYGTVMHPLVEGETLSAIYVNLDSRVLKNYKSKLRSAEQIETAERRFISSVYFHTLFLYMINRNRKYEISEPANDDGMVPVDLTDYLKDLFESYYSEFLLNFEMHELITALE